MDDTAAGSPLRQLVLIAHHECGSGANANNATTLANKLVTVTQSAECAHSGSSQFTTFVPVIVSIRQLCHTGKVLASTELAVKVLLTVRLSLFVAVSLFTAVAAYSSYCSTVFYIVSILTLSHRQHVSLTALFTVTQKVALEKTHLANSPVSNNDHLDLIRLFLCIWERHFNQNSTLLDAAGLIVESRSIYKC